jgi:hypothetical protein
MAYTACLVCFISSVSGCSKKKKPWKTAASSGHITNLKQSILDTFDVYDYFKGGGSAWTLYLFRMSMLLTEGETESVWPENRLKCCPIFGQSG